MPLLFALAWLPGVRESALFDPDEGRNASIGLAMSESGDWLIPQLNGLPFLDKPFLFFALESLAIRLLGVSELAARLPSLVAGLLLVGLVAWWARRVWDGRTAIRAGGALASSLLVVAFARSATFDALLALLTTAALISFHQAIDAYGNDEVGAGRSAARPAGWRSPRGRWLLVAWLAMALGTLVKGPVAILLPLGVAWMYAGLRGRGRAVWSVPSVGAALGLLVLWLALTELRMPGFLHYALVEESWQRVTTGKFQRTGPLWYFLPVLFAGVFPWILAPFLGARTLLRERGRQRPELLFLALWWLAPLLLLSLSQSKRPQYMLPLVPAVALLAAWTLGHEKVRVLFVRVAGVFWLILGVVLLAGRSGWSGRWGQKQGLGAETVGGFLLGLAIAMLFAGAAGVASARRGDFALIAVALPILVLPFLARPVVLAVSEDRSTRQLAAALAPFVTKDLAVVGIDTFVPSLPFYLGRNIVLAASDLDELTSNSMRAFEPSIRASGTASYRPEAYWRERLAGFPDSTAFLLRAGRESERAELEAAGLQTVYASRKYLVLAGVFKEPG